MTTVHEMHEVQKAPTRVPRYLAPATLTEALEIMAEYGSRARPVAGGTDLTVELDRGIHTGVDALVDLSRLGELALVELDGESVRLGAMVTHNQVVASETCRSRILPLAQACLEIGSPQLRNRATVAGNIVTASPANDTISALLALGAVVEISSTDGVRQVPVGEFFTGFRSTVLAPHELVTAIDVPALAANHRGVFVKAGLRRAQAISVVHLAMVIGFEDDGNTVTDATLALGSVAATVITVPDFEQVLTGQPLASGTIAAAAAAAVEAATPIDDLRATADYRSTVIATMVQRGLAAIAEGREATQWPVDTPLLDTRSAAVAPDGPDDGATSGIDFTASDEISCVTNGAAISASGAVGVTLLDWLRDEAGLTGVKEGCAEGECGACTVMLGGQAIMSCLTPAARAHGSTVVTVEGLAAGKGATDTGGNGRLSPIQDAFIQNGGVQCGFCTPGFLVSCAALLDEHPDPTLDQIKQGLAGNLCRCTGYKTIEAAVRQAAESVGTTQKNAQENQS